MAEVSRIIKRFGESKPRFTVTDRPEKFQGMPNLSLYLPEPNYEDLSRFYGLDLGSFREKIANLTNPEVLENYSGENLNINWVTSVDVLAARKGVLSRGAFFQLAAIGVVKTRDNQILVGVRGGKVTAERVDMFASGLYGTPPAGSVRFKPEYEVDPITDTMAEEFVEELGDFDITTQEVLGVFEAYRPGPTGIKFLSGLETDATLLQIQDANIRSNQLRVDLLKKGASMEEVKHEIGQRKLPVDGWEHLPIVGIPNSSYAIRSFIQSQPQSFPGIGYGALELYIQQPLYK